MEVTSAVDVGETSQQLFHDAFDLIERESISATKALVFSDVVENRALDVLEDEVHIALHSNDFLQLYHVFVVQSPQCFHFTQAHGLIPAIKLPLHFLNGDCFTSCLVYGLDNSAVCTIAAVFYNLELIHAFGLFKVVFKSIWLGN